MIRELDPGTIHQFRGARAPGEHVETWVVEAAVPPFPCGAGAYVELASGWYQLVGVTTRLQLLEGLKYQMVHTYRMDGPIPR